MKILVLNPFAGGMKELERSRKVAGADTEIVFEDISDVYPLNYVTYISHPDGVHPAELPADGHRRGRFTGSPHRRSSSGGPQGHRVHGGGQAGGAARIESFRNLAEAASGRD